MLLLFLCHSKSNNTILVVPALRRRDQFSTATNVGFALNKQALPGLPGRDSAHTISRRAECI